LAATAGVWRNLAAALSDQGVDHARGFLAAIEIVDERLQVAGTEILGVARLPAVVTMACDLTSGQDLSRAGRTRRARGSA
jgi:hypothetical protein